MAQRDRIDLLLEEYRILAEFHHSEVGAFWQRHAIYLAVSTAFIGALALARPETATRGDEGLIAGSLAASAFAKAICGAGVAAALAWLVAIVAGLQYSRLYCRLMEEIEQAIPLPTGIAAHMIRPSWLRQLFSIRVWSGALPVAFIAVWVYLFARAG